MDTMVPSELELELEQGESIIELRSQQACRNLQLELYFLSFWPRINLCKRSFIYQKADLIVTAERRSWTFFMQFYHRER